MSVLQPHQQRVVEEFDALNEKIAKLEDFLVTALFSSLPSFDQELLRQQHSVMKIYAVILEARINRF